MECPEYQAQIDDLKDTIIEAAQELRQIADEGAMNVETRHSILGVADDLDPPKKQLLDLPQWVFVDDKGYSTYGVFWATEDGLYAWATPYSRAAPAFTWGYVEASSWVVKPLSGLLNLPTPEVSDGE